MKRRGKGTNMQGEKGETIGNKTVGWRSMETGKFTQIFRLETLLCDAGIPYEKFDYSTTYIDPGEKEAYAFFKIKGDKPPEDDRIRESYQICYPGFRTDIRICSVIQSWVSYGGVNDLLEIQGLTHEENDVEGHLDANEVFERIKKHYRGTK